MILRPPLRSPLSAVMRRPTAFSRGAFDPGTLFTGGLPGAWYEPKDLGTLYQDTAGATAVYQPGAGAIDPPVGLMLDKRAGLTAGSDILSNGDFITDTLWTKGAGCTISGGSLNATAFTGYVAFQNRPAQVVGYYEVTFAVTNYVGGTVRAYVGYDPVFTPSVAANGTFTFRVAAKGVNEVGINSTGFTGSIDSISARLIAGNHASQATASARPVLTARVNILTKTEQFDDVAWAKTNAAISPNVITTPDGQLKADKIVEDSTTSAHRVERSVDYRAGAWCQSVIAKAGERSFLQLASAYTSQEVTSWTNFDLATGTRQTFGSDVSEMVSLGGGWYRCSRGRVMNSGAGQTYMTLAVSLSSLLLPAYAGNGTSGLYVSEAQVAPGLAAVAYQRVNTDVDYDTAGFPLAEQFDSIDDGMSTAAFPAGTLTSNMDFFAAVRRDSAAASVLMSVGNANYFGYMEPTGGNASVGSGTPTFYVDGVLVSAASGGATNLHLSMTVGVWHVLEVRNLDLSAWTLLRTGMYPGYCFGGAIHQIILCPAQTDAKRTQIRQYLAAKVGVTLP
jgi:hypothetical protein